MIYKCNKCGKEYENRHAFLGHCSSHNRTGPKWLKRRTKKKQKESIVHSCKFCGRVFERGVQLGGHVPWCKKNPKYEKRLRQQSVISKRLWKDKEYADKVSNGISETLLQKSREGNWHNSFSKARTYDYRGVKLYGKWELKYAMWLDAQSIQWERSEESFPYVFDGVERRYTPDFYLVDSDEYIEVKGYETAKDRAKWKHFPHKLTILKGKDLFEMGIIDSYRKV